MLPITAYIIVNPYGQHPGLQFMGCLNCTISTFNLAKNPAICFSKLVMRSQVPKVGPRKIGDP